MNKEIKKLRDECRLRGIRNYEIADICGVTREAVSRWWNGKTEMRVEHYIKISKLLDKFPEIIHPGNGCQYCVAEYSEDGLRESLMYEIVDLGVLNYDMNSIDCVVYEDELIMDVFDACEFRKKINYCPMCGRRLRED